MRRGYLLLLPAMLGLMGATRAPAGSTPLSIDSIFCDTSYSGGYFICTAQVSGGSGSYNSFSWTFTERYAGEYAGQWSEWTYVPEVSGSCSPGTSSLEITLTVTDSQWNTATGYGGMYCD